MIMDPKLFQQRLEELAELRVISPSRTAHVREATEPIDIFREGQEFEISHDSNPTLTTEIIKLKNTRRPCDDCGNIVDNRRVERRLYTSFRPHWREECMSCHRYRDANGLFTMNAVQIQNYFRIELQPVSAVKNRRPAK